MDRTSYHYEFINEQETAKLLTYLLISLNVLYAILGALMLSAAFFLCFDDRFSIYIDELDLKKYMTGVYILMTAGLLVMVQAFFGVCGAYMKIRKLLIVFLIMTIVCFILELTGSIILLTHGVTDSKMEIEIERKIYSLMDSYTTDTAAKRSLDLIQENVGCCGAQGVSDYIRWNMVVPFTCYNPVTGNAWHNFGLGFVGCVSGVARKLEIGSGWICGFALVLAFLQLFGMVATVLLMKMKDDFKSMHDVRKR